MLHSDLWGAPSVVPSLVEKQYFITFIDDYSRKVWIYFLKTKDKAFSKFKEWKLEVENQTSKKVKCLRTENGLEYCNIKFDEFCKGAGIKRHRICVYTPQQNGVSERMNRTIMERVRCMLEESGMEESFWAEAASTAVYLINRSPSSAIEFKIPEELWSRFKPSLSHLKIFGCSAYVHSVKTKTSTRATKGYFVGYPQGTKGFRVLMPEEGRCVISRNVIFHEEEMFKDSLKSQEPRIENAESEKAQGKKTEKRKGKKVSFSPDLIKGPSSCLHDSEASTSGAAAESTDSGGAGSSSDTTAESTVEES